MMLSIFISLKRFGHSSSHLVKVPIQDFCSWPSLASLPKRDTSIHDGDTIQNDVKEKVEVTGSLLFATHPSCSAPPPPGSLEPS